MAEYRLTLDPEGKAVLEAALGPLSAPQPVEGERDLRSSDRRRGDALVTLVRRAVESAELTPKGAKSQLFVTVDLETLRSGVTGAGEVLAGTQSGDLLGPETMRRLACDAMIIPTVMGVEGAVVDLGRQERLFTLPQVRRLWLRDRHCTYPGCTMPAQWADAHHLIHWADGGPSDLSNAALLCERHHTVVHTRRYAGRLVEDEGGSRVEWDRRVGVRRTARRARRAPTSVTLPRTPSQADGSQPWARRVRDHDVGQRIRRAATSAAASVSSVSMPLSVIAPRMTPPRRVARPSSAR